jgi:hypothetical protein
MRDETDYTRAGFSIGNFLATEISQNVQKRAPEIANAMGEPGHLLQTSTERLNYEI